MSSSKLSTAMLLLLSLGCAEEIKTVSPKAVNAAKAEMAEQVAKPKPAVEIGEFNAADGKQVVDSKVKISNPLTGALEAYQPLKEQVAGLGITHALGLFQALEGRYPKDHDEFMTKVIKQNNIRLPNLGPGKSYEYDVQNHKLVIVIDPPADE